MEPKISVKDAAKVLGITIQSLHKKIQHSNKIIR